MASFPTMPARADFLTGRWTMSFMQWEPLPRSEITIAQLLRSKDIHTAAIVDTPFYLRNGMGYDRDFHTFIEIPGQRQQGKPKEMFRGQGTFRKFQSECYAVQTFSSAMRWLEENYKDNFFLMIDVWDPHEPWDAPIYYTEPYWPGYDGEIIRPIYGYWQKEPGYTDEKVKKAHATYCGEATMVDTWIGYLLKQVENMGLMENTAIIFTTDHGYYFGEHGGLFGKMVFARDAAGKRIMGIWSYSPYYEEVSALPLLIYVPNTKPGTYSGLTSAVDLMPTILDLFGCEIPSVVEGRSLVSAVRDPTLKGREYVVSAHPFTNAGDMVKSVDDIGRKGEMASTASVTTNEWSLLYVVEPGLSELHHLTSDPKQEKNIITERPDVARDLHQTLIDFMKKTKLPPRLLEPRLELRL
jgi:arylsulfatase A-like enzyme